MRAKISDLDPVGKINESVEFVIPLIADFKPTYYASPTGQYYPTEPMKRPRYLLRIGEHEYIMDRTGLITEKITNVILDNDDHIIK